MIGGLVRILLFQGLGELISKFVVPLVPGPVIGLLLLLGWLLARRQVDDDLQSVAAAFSRHLGVLFVPAAVGVVTFLPQLREHAVALAVVLVVSVIATVAVTALILRFGSRESSRGA
ncbi:MAG: CidA/LrgA family protein [Burkholderiales bacterium]|nr:CidA/LrgA family protein [Burkholderiales bacterium]